MSANNSSCEKVILVKDICINTEEHTVYKSKEIIELTPKEYDILCLLATNKGRKDCLYIWSGKKEDSSTLYLYVGIVGDSKREGLSKRNLAQRLKEEEKKFYKECGVRITQFRFCSLNNAYDYSVPELLKTVEMSEITVMTSLFKCDNARDNIDALLSDFDVVLLNKMTSYKYVK